MSRKIAFVGYGELGKQYHTFLEIKEFDNVVYFDYFCLFYNVHSIGLNLNFGFFKN